MKKIILAAISIAVSTVGSLAVAATHSLVVNFNDGKTVEYEFFETPRVTFSGDDIQITSFYGTNDISQPVSDVTNFTFKTKDGAVEKITDNATHIVVNYDGSTLSVSGLGTASKVSIYSVAGMLCKSAAADAAGAVKINVSDLANGVYVVSSKEHTFKFIKK